MKINPKTMFFEELELHEACALLEISAGIQIRGDFPNGNPYFEQWIKECNFDERQRLLVGSTVFPARASHSAALCFQLLLGSCLKDYIDDRVASDRHGS